MAQLIVRDVAPEVVRALKMRAAAHRELPRLNRACAVVCLLLSCAAPEPGPPPDDSGTGTVCDHSSCSGCCQNGVCYSGYENLACGQLGQQCVACPAWNPCSKTRRCAPPEAPSEAPPGGYPSQQGPGGAVVQATVHPPNPDAGEDAGVSGQTEKPSNCYDQAWVWSCP
jgi:hypothetical protein